MLFRSHGVLGATAEVQRTQGCQDALKRTPGIKVAAEATANWDETQAYKAAQNMLQANPNITAIFGESDAMGLGAAKAAKDANRKIISVGIDGFPTMVAGIYGMNFEHMPELHYKFGYPIAIASLALISLYLYVRFKKAGWL